MSGNIEVFEDGTAAYVGAREDAWHRLGITLPSEFTIEEGFALAKLGDWNVRKHPLQATFLDEDGVRTVEVPGRHVMVRTNPVTRREELIGEDTAGVVGSRYEPFQNESLAAFLQAVLDQSGACIDTMGSIENGRNVFIAMRLPKDVLIGGVDRINQFFTVTNNHVGTGAIRSLISPIRVVCRNTLNAAFGSAVSSFKIRHTATAGQRVQEAREALDLTFRYVDTFQAEAERMINQSLAVDEFKRVCRELWPEPKATETDRVKTGDRNRLTSLMYLFTEADTQENCRGTRWAAYNSIVEHLDFYAPVNGKTADAKAVNRATRSIVGSVGATKEQAFALLSV